MTAAEKATRRMHYRIADADRMICDIERMARRAGIKITVNFGAELAHTHDAIASLDNLILNLEPAARSETICKNLPNDIDSVTIGGMLTELAWRREKSCSSK